MFFVSDERRRPIILILLVLFAATGCATVTEQIEKTEKWVRSLNSDTPDETAAPQTSQEVSPAPGLYMHRVTWAGESLSIVAKWYTGNLDNWKAIAKANPEIRPDFLQTGMVIRIPAAMMVNHDPLSQEFVASHYSKDARRSKSAQSPPADLPLIGPKSYSDE